MSERSESNKRDADPRSVRGAERLINGFYSSLQRRDWRSMVQLYHTDIFFYDPVFGNLEGRQVGAMWEMLLSGAGELDLQFGEIVIDGGYGSCAWTAKYLFSATGRRVVNKGKAMFRFEDGKIIEHQDAFSFWRWSRQALGWKGFVFGWTTIFQRAVRKKARTKLERYIKK